MGSKGRKSVKKSKQAKEKKGQAQAEVKKK